MPLARPRRCNLLELHRAGLQRFGVHALPHLAEPKIPAVPVSRKTRRCVGRELGVEGDLGDLCIRPKALAKWLTQGFAQCKKETTATTTRS